MARSVEHHPRAWARLRVDVNCALRRGAWYRAVRLTRDNVTLDVSRERVPVPRRLLQTMFAAPARWSVVPRPSDAVNLPDEQARATSCARAARVARRSAVFRRTCRARTAAGCSLLRGMSTT